MSPLPRWTLADLYTDPNDPRIASIFIEARTQTNTLVERFKARLAGCSSEDLHTLLQGYEQLLQSLAKPLSYASLRQAMNTDDAEREGFERRTREQAIAIERDLLWVELEIAQLSEETLEAHIKSPVLASYTHVLEKILLVKAHQLDEAREQLLNDLSQTSSEAFANLFEQEDGTKRFQDGDTTHTLTELLSDLSDVKQETRKHAASIISQGLEDDAQRRAFIYTTLIKHKQITDRYRAFATPESSRHLANETTPAAVQTLVEATEEATPMFHTYYTWKAQKLGLSPLYDYDRYAPIDDVERVYTFEEAHAIIQQAFTKFSPRFAEVAETFFTHGWIDAAPTQGKRGGAFCSYVSADHHPYVFVNFQGRVGDVLTLAHELGHAIHASLARPNGHLSFDTPLTLAETASVFAEMLVFDDLRASLQNRPQDLQALCAKKVESIFATVFRQITLYRFEQEAHAHVRREGYATPLTYHTLWQKVHAPLFGSAITMTEGYRTWWSYISHFFPTPFYVYAYAYGELLTCCLYETYKEGTMPDFAERYMAFLAKGGTASPSELLAPLGINPNDRLTWERGLKWIAQLVNDTISV